MQIPQWPKQSEFAPQAGTGRPAGKPAIALSPQQPTGNIKTNGRLLSTEPVAVSATTLTFPKNVPNRVALSNIGGREEVNGVVIGDRYDRRSNTKRASPLKFDTWKT
jgi:hypothetical protein